jgi:hypothetical protein
MNFEIFHCGMFRHSALLDVVTNASEELAASILVVEVMRDGQDVGYTALGTYTLKMELTIPSEKLITISNIARPQSPEKSQSIYMEHSSVCLYQNDLMLNS